MACKGERGPSSYAVHFGNTFSKTSSPDVCALARPHRSERLVPSQTWLRWSPLETTDMSPQRFAKVAVMCGTVVLAAWCGGRLGVGPALVETTAAVPVVERPAALLPALPANSE